LLVEIRQVHEGSATAGAAGSWGTSQHEQLWTPLRVQVRNGSKARLSLGLTEAVQWMQSVTGFNTSQSVTGGETTSMASSTSSTAKGGSATGSSSGGGLGYGMMMMETGQQLVVQPTWGGGNQAALVDIMVQTARIQHASISELPAQLRTELVSSIRAPLGHWVTIASSGASVVAGNYSSEAPQTQRKLLQLRISTP
jgi:hypothetical protein